MIHGGAHAHRGLVPGQVAEIIVSLDGESGRRGAGYRVRPSAVLTVAHVVDGAVSVQVRFDADLPGEWVTEMLSCWTDPRSDLAVLTIAPREDELPVTAARFGLIGDRAAVLAARAVGFPRWKLRTDEGDRSVYRDSHQADGSVAVLSNRREGTLEVTVPPPERDPDPETSPWEGMSGAAVWIGERIVGVIAKHHRADGLGRLAAARLDLALDGLDPGRRVELKTLLGLPDVLPDVVPPTTGERVTTAYQAQVRDIAPDQLLDREEELDGLVRFCAGDQPYAWWQAGPWAGKSALMAWFVLHPPAGVDVVSFFVTTRLAGQSDSDACTDALIEQLAALLGESPVGLLTVGARRGTMLRLLDDAASRAREAGRRLLLVIDGLDEDSGTATGGPSIAALLPRRPPAEVRVLVASRPHPPIPDDVDDDHPLRSITARQLEVSRHARGIERRAKHELGQLLAGSQLQRDVLGLITAAGGGLTMGDLQELTQRSPYQIEGLLDGVFGRSVGSRMSSSGALLPQSAERVYLFTHETLRLVAEQQYGSSLVAYHDRLHAWADNYRQRNWPADTPLYLLRSYPRMLASTGDLTRLTACATDQARHDRMRSLTGGDAFALTEINTAQQLLLAQPDPNLANLAFIAIQRKHLTDRNADILIDLPAVWAKLGQFTRAEAIANSIPDPDRRAQALTRLVEVAAERGNHNRAADLVSTIETLTVQITDPCERAQTVSQLAVVMARSGDRDQAARLADEVSRLADEAEILISQIPDPIVRSSALCQLAEAVAAAGDHSRAETLTTQIIEPGLRAEALGRLATLMAAGDNRTRATRLIDEAEALIGLTTDRDWRVGALCQLAEATLANDDFDRAAHLLGEMAALAGQFAGTYEDERAELLCQLAHAMVISGDHAHAARLSIEAEAFTEQIIHPYERVELLCQLAEIAVACGDQDRAARLISEAEPLTERTTYPGPWGHLLARLAYVVAAGGDYDRAKILVTQIPDPGLRAWASGRLAEAAAERDEHDQNTRLVSDAENLIVQLTDPYARALALSQLAAAVLTGGDEGQAVQLAEEAEALAVRLTDPGSQAQVFGRLAELAAAGCHYDRAEKLIAQITEPGARAGALAQLTRAVDADGDHDRATRLVREVEAFTDRISNHYQCAKALVDVAVTLRTINDNTTLVPEHSHKSSQALVRSRSLFAEALTIGWQNAFISDLALIDPAAVSALADELEVRWKLCASTTP